MVFDVIFAVTAFLMVFDVIFAVTAFLMVFDVIFAVTAFLNGLYCHICCISIPN
jgi:hypothetical protein